MGQAKHAGDDQTTLVAILIIAALLGLREKWQAFDLLGRMTHAQRADLYSKALGPLSIIASVATAGLAVYATSRGPRMSLLRSVHGEHLLQQFRGAAVAAALAVVALLVSYVGELSYKAPWSRWLALGAFVFVVARAIRVLYFYNGLLITAGDDGIEPARRPSLDEMPVTRPRKSSSA